MDEELSLEEEAGFEAVRKGALVAALALPERVGIAVQFVVW